MSSDLRVKNAQDLEYLRLAFAVHYRQGKHRILSQSEQDSPGWTLPIFWRARPNCLIIRGLFSNTSRSSGGKSDSLSLSEESTRLRRFTGGFTAFFGEADILCLFGERSADVDTMSTSSSSSVVLAELWLWMLELRVVLGLINVVAGVAGLTFALPANVADAFRLLEVKESFPCFMPPEFVFGAIVIVRMSEN